MLTYKLISKDVSKKINNKNILNRRNDLFISNKIYTLTGHSGCGKSTYLSILAGINDFSSGEISFNEKNIFEFSTEKFFLEICAYVPQEPILSSYININAMFDLQIILLKNIFEEDFLLNQKKLVLNSLKLENLLNSFSEELSGGEKHRVAIGLSLIGKKKLLIFDEPTSSLDQENSENFIKIVRKYILENSSICILSSHDPLIINNSDKIIEI